MFPGTVMYVYIGWTIGELPALFSREDRTLGETLFFFAGLALTIVATIYITRLAKRALSQAIAEAGAGESHA